MSLANFAENIALAHTNAWYFPGRTIFGVGTVGQLGDLAKPFGAKRALIVTDKTVGQLELIKRVSTPLTGAGLEVSVHDKLGTEPTLESVRGVVEFNRKGNYDLVVGVGGGAVLDTSKLVAALATNPGDVRDYLKGWEDAFPKKSLPKILIPTTSGTGSEMDNGALVTDGPYKKYSTGGELMPNVAVIDPTMTLTCPPRLTAGCGFDAMTHCIDGMLTTRGNSFAGGAALEGIRLVSENLANAVHSGADLQARYNMSMASMLGGIVMDTATSAYPTHMIGELLGPKYGIPHGIMMAIGLPHAMRFAMPVIPNVLVSIAKALGKEVTGLSKREAALQSIAAVTELLEAVDLPSSLKGMKIPKGQVSEDVKILLEDRQHFYGVPHFGPKKLTTEGLTALLDKIWEGT